MLPRTRPKTPNPSFPPKVVQLMLRIRRFEALTPLKERVQDTRKEGIRDRSGLGNQKGMLSCKPQTLTRRINESVRILRTPRTLPTLSELQDCYNLCVWSPELTEHSGPKFMHWRLLLSACLNQIWSSVANAMPWINTYVWFVLAHKHGIKEINCLRLCMSCDPTARIDRVVFTFFQFISKLSRSAKYIWWQVEGGLCLPSACDF